MRIPSEHELPGRLAPIRAASSTRRLKPPGHGIPALDERDALEQDPTITTGKHQTSVIAKLPEAGSFVRQYQLIRELGHGGMSTVFLARDTQLGRLVALKFLTYRSAEANNRLLDEARATARCQHENIVIIHEFGEHDGCTFIALEYLKGQTLQALMLKQPLLDPDARDKARVPLPARRAVEIMVPVVRALVQAHAMGILHRDLKPANILLTEMGAIKVLDFGIAKALSRLDIDMDRDTGTDNAELLDNLAHTLTGAMVGTLPYMAPEQVNLDEIDHRCDIWACGIILYEMVVGKHPLAPLSSDRLREAAHNLGEPMPSTVELMPELGTLAGIIDRCLIKKKEDRTATAAALLAELEALVPHRRLQTLTTDARPFAGLEAFQEANADRFFGRGQEVAAAVARLRSHPLLAVVGPSGAGKSSLIRAGIMPALKRSGEGWDAVSLRPGRNPLAALAGMLDHAQASMSLSSAGGLGPSASLAGERELDRDDLTLRLQAEPGFLAARLRNRASKKLRRSVIFIDQFEELYTLTPPGPERDAFIRCIAAVADDISSPLRVILSIRSDFLHQMAEDRAFAALVTQGLLFLPPLGRDALREALVRPIEAADYRFESEAMITSMLDELEGARSALPLLQFTGAKLWDMRDRDRRVLAQSSYEQIGGVAGALTSHADAVLAAMSSSDQALARIVLEELVTPEHTRAMASVSELCARGRDASGIERVIDHLARARLLVVETGLEDQEGATVELIHESLIESWPTLRHWLSEHREDAAFLGRLRTAAKQWHASGRTEGLLWRGEPAREAERWRMRYRGELSRLEREYLDATMALENRAARRKRALIAGSMAFLVLLIVAGSVALFSIRRAEMEAKRQAAIVKQQLAELQNKDTALRSKEQESRQATQEAQMTKEQLREALEQERMTKQEAVQARDEAQQSEQVARQAEQAARQAEQAARQALERAERAAQAEREAKEDLQRFIGLGPRSTARGIRFNYKPRNTPREVYIAGTFNGWNPNNDFMLRDEDGDGIYSITVPLSRGTYQYKFFVDGVWVKDPNAPMTESDGFGGLNGVFEVK